MKFRFKVRYIDNYIDTYVVTEDDIDNAAEYINEQLNIIATNDRVIIGSVVLNMTQVQAVEIKESKNGL